MGGPWRKRCNVCGGPHQGTGWICASCLKRILDARGGAEAYLRGIAPPKGH